MAREKTFVLDDHSCAISSPAFGIGALGAFCVGYLSCSAEDTTSAGGSGGRGSGSVTSSGATTSATSGTAGSATTSATGSAATTGAATTTTGAAGTAGKGGSAGTTSTGAGGAGQGGRPQDAGGGSGGGALADVGVSGFPTVTSFDVDACHDLDIAVSPTLVAVATNPGVIVFYTKTGTLDHRAQPFAGASIGDAHISWDASSSRWFFSTLQNVGGVDGAYVYASKDDAGKTWTANAKVVGPTNLDNPQLVVTSDKVAVLDFECIYTLDKDAVMAGATPNLMAVASCGITHNDQVYGVDYGPQVPSTAYFIGMNDTNRLNWISVEGTPKAGNVKMTQHPTALSPGFKFLAAFPGVTAFGGAVTRNSGQVGEWFADHLWWSRTGTCGTVTCPRMFDVNTATGALHDFNLTMDGNSLWSTAPGVDKGGNMWALAAQTSATVPISLAVGGMSAAGALVPLQTVVKGNGAFPADQFGDFFDMAQDPADGSVWGVGNYAIGANACGARVVHVVTK